MFSLLKIRTLNRPLKIEIILPNLGLHPLKRETTQDVETREVERNQTPEKRIWHSLRPLIKVVTVKVRQIKKIPIERQHYEKKNFTGKDSEKVYEVGGTWQKVFKRILEGNQR